MSSFHSAISASCKQCTLKRVAYLTRFQLSEDSVSKWPCVIRMKLGTTRSPNLHRYKARHHCVFLILIFMSLCRIMSPNQSDAQWGQCPRTDTFEALNRKPPDWKLVRRSFFPGVCHASSRNKKDRLPSAPANLRPERVQVRLPPVFTGGVSRGIGSRRHHKMET